jgi:hypothetical protein
MCIVLRLCRPTLRIHSWSLQHLLAQVKYEDNKLEVEECELDLELFIVERLLLNKYLQETMLTSSMNRRRNWVSGKGAPARSATNQRRNQESSSNFLIQRRQHNQTSERSKAGLRKN